MTLFFPLIAVKAGGVSNALINPPNSSIDWYFNQAGPIIHLTFKNANVLMAMFTFSVNGSQDEAIVLFPLQTSQDRQYFNQSGYYHISMFTPASAACITAMASWED